MSERQRYFSGVERVMRRAPVGAGRLHLSPTEGGGGVVAEKPKIDLSRKVEVPAQNAQQVVSEYLESFRWHLNDLREHQGTISIDAFQKVTDDISKLIDQHEKVTTELADLKRDHPDPSWGEGNLKEGSLSHISLSLRVDPEREREDKDAGVHIAELSRERYNLLCRAPESLGIEDKGALRMVKRYHQLHDGIAYAMLYWSVKNRATFRGWESLACAEEYKALGKKLRIALAGNAIGTGTATAGSEWVPSQVLSGQIIPLVEQRLRTIAALRPVQMLGPTYALPVLGAHALGYYAAENLDADGLTATAKIAAANFTTKLVTFAAKKIVAGLVVTPEWMQDAVSAATEFINPELAFVIARTLENLCWNGQKSGAIDAAAIAAGDNRLAVDGIRKMFSQETGITTLDLGAGMTAEAGAKMFGQQGDYGIDAENFFWGCSPSGVAILMITKTSTGQNVAMTMAEAGDQATYPRGTMALFWGRPVLPSNFISDQMSAAGIIPNPVQARTAIYGVHGRSIGFGTRAGIALDFSNQYRFLEDQDVFKATVRIDQQPLYAIASNKIVSAGFNLSLL